MALDRKELLLLVQEYIGHTPRDKGLRSFFEMSEQLTDKIMKLEKKDEEKLGKTGV